MWKVSVSILTTQLVQTPPGKIVSGEVILDGEIHLKYGRLSKKCRLSGAEISEIFGLTMTSLNPVFYWKLALGCSYDLKADEEAWKR